MSAPRHLWSGDWELESSAHAEDLAARRGRGEEPAETEPVAPPPRQSRLRQAIRMLRARLGRVRAPSRRRLRVAGLVGVLVVLGAAAAYAATSGSTPTRTQEPAAVTATSPAWLGVDLANAPVRGAVVAKVVPGSPAAKAGIRPGDVITQLDTQPIETPAILTSAIGGMQPGDQIDIQLQRGSSQYTVHVALGSLRAGTP
jgi:membrane-associated protease RseP (regulator of RpoE activity)